MIFLLFVAAMRAAGEEGEPSLSREKLIASAESCGVTPIAMGETTIGTLGPGDCTDGFGRYLDVYRFQPRAGWLIESTLRPLAPTLSSPLLALVAPQHDGRTPPVVVGGTSLEVRFLSRETDECLIAVSTQNRGASGDYLLDLDGILAGDGFLPSGCESQRIRCGQTIRWVMNSETCSFTRSKRYVQFVRYLASENDSIHIEMESDSFPPTLLLLDDMGVVRSSSKTVANRAILDHSNLSKGYHWLYVISDEVGKSGPYELRAVCANAGCQVPIIYSKPSTEVVPRGAPATFSVAANGTLPFSYSWLDLNDLSFTNGDYTFSTRPLVSDAYYNVTVGNDCGTDTSGNYVGMVVEPERSRPSRR